MSDLSRKRRQRIPTALQVLVVGVGGALGAVARVLTDLALSPASWPVGTFVANVLGCVLLAALTAYAATRQINPLLKLGLGTGFCGAYTTFSTVLLLFTTLTFPGYLGYLVLTVVACLIAVFVTHAALSTWLVRRQRLREQG